MYDFITQMHDLPIFLDQIISLLQTLLLQIGLNLDSQLNS
jgi:hypothetical protein